MTVPLNNIAIIGAGLGGAALALALSASFHQARITIYESRPKDKLSSISSGVILTPNGLAILDKLGILPLIEKQCYISTYRCFKDREDVTTSKTAVALKDKYGYSNHRLWRSVLLECMLEVLSSRQNVSVLYDRRLVEISSYSENQSGIGFKISNTNSSILEDLSADILFGVDGINSIVRNILHPEIDPEYTGTTGLLTHIPRDSVSWPYADYERNATIQDIPGALFFLPEDPACRTIMVGRQFRDLPPSIINDRKAFEELQNDKTKLCELYRERYDEYGPTARKILDSISQHTEAIYMWPMMHIPHLPTWFRADDGRVVILGDAAHALPPSSGQGVNQALEDAWMLTLLLNKISQSSAAADGVPVLHQTELLAALQFWQAARQTRVDQIYTWATTVQNTARMSKVEREKVEAEQREKRSDSGQRMDDKQSNDMAWLYTPQIEDEIRNWNPSHARVV